MEQRVTIIESARHDLKKIVFTYERGLGKYYAVVFYDEIGSALNICASSQIGCCENCKFCATAGFPFQANLSADQICEQFEVAINAMREHTHKCRKLYVLMEGMGEPSYNIANCLSALQRSLPGFHNNFDSITYRVSSVGNVAFLNQYVDFANAHFVKDRLEFKLQLSLHSALQRERLTLIPDISRRYDIGQIANHFVDASSRMVQKLRCNYMLLNYPDGGCNYTDAHISTLIGLFHPPDALIKLTRYSETHRGFSSPSEAEFERMARELRGSGFEVRIKDLLGSDIQAACGMLHYK